MQIDTRNTPRFILSVALTTLLLSGCGMHDSQDHDGGSHVATAEFHLPAGAEEAAKAIDEATLSTAIEELSDDSYEGRGPSTPGDEKTQQFLIDRLVELGFEPGGPGGSWKQPINIHGITSDMPKTWTFGKDGKTYAATWWDDYVGTSGVQEDSTSIEDAEVVFVGYGIQAPEEEWDDFKGADLKGKVLLMLNNDPDWDPDMFAGTKRLYYGRWTYKYESAARQGAVGAIIIHTTPSAGYPFGVVQGGWSGVQFELPAGDEPRVRLAAWLTEDAAGQMVALAGLDLEELVASARSPLFHPLPLGVTTSISFRTGVDRSSTTANVVGVLPGRDPELKEEYVIYSAHHDHMGIGQADESGDAIFNGARDNASGVASILAVAKAFAALPERPRRSIMILPVAAEEQGLLGSRFYSRNPTVHPGRIAANINLDAVNIFGRTHDVGVVGIGKSSLEELLAAAAELQGRVVVNEPDPDKGYYYRSDQFNFAKIGVPALYFHAGHEYIDRPAGWGKEMADGWRTERYHQPSDEVYEDWDYAGMIEDAQLAFWVGLSVAESDALPAWKPGDEFEAIRRQALADAGH